MKEENKKKLLSNTIEDFEKNQAYITQVFLRKITEALPQYVFWKDVNSCYLGCNENFAYLLGLRDPKEIIGKTDMDLNWDSTGHTAEDFLQGDKDTMYGKPITNCEEVLALPNGKQIVTLVSKKPIVDNDEVIGVVGYFTDISDLKRLEQELLDSKARETESLIKQELFNTAAQVSHDIRSPLAALNTALTMLTQLPEDQRVLIRHAVSRINDIANNLLNQYQINYVNPTGGAAVGSTTEQLTFLRAEFLFNLLGSIISEKNIQLKEKLVSIQLEVEETGHSIFVMTDASEFKRAISNVLNNAIEAIESTGEVIVSMSRNGGYARIVIEDNGEGIPKKILPKVKQGGFSYGKADGSGIGIASIIELTKKSKGYFDIQSEVGVGTKVIMELAAMPPPNWFMEELALEKGTRVVVLDDDRSIHSIWVARFQTCAAEVQIEHFYQDANFREYCQSKDVSNTLFLVDYELIGSNATGLELIEELGIAHQSILVTSRYEEQHVKSSSASLGVKIIPKNYSPFIPIVMKEVTNIDLVLIDDDPVLVAAWEQKAKLVGKAILACTSIADFEQHLHDISCETPIYIDSNLGSGIKGETYAKMLHDQGYRSLYLATGMDRAQFGEMPWIADVVGKEPPF